MVNLENLTQSVLFTKLYIHKTVIMNILGIGFCSFIVILILHMIIFHIFRDKILTRARCKLVLYPIFLSLKVKLYLT